MQTNQSIDFAAIKAAVSVSSVVSRVVPLKRAGRELVGCCPFHADRSPSFYVNDEEGFFHCFGCGVHGDAVDFIANHEVMSIGEAARLLGSPDLRMTVRPPAPCVPETDSDTMADAVAMWRAAGPLIDTLGAVYLRGRGLTLLSPSLRFARLRYGRRGEYPAIVAAIQSAVGPVQGIQRVFLAPDGGGKAEVPKAKLSLGKVKGGAIRLGPIADELVLVEGLEDGLTVAQALPNVSVWVCCGTGMLPAVELPYMVRSIVIAADNDGAGKVAAERAGGAYASQGLAVRIMRPDAVYKDFNDELQGIRYER